MLKSTFSVSPLAFSNWGVSASTAAWMPVDASTLISAATRRFRGRHSQPAARTTLVTTTFHHLHSPGCGTLNGIMNRYTRGLRTHCQL